MTETTRIRWRDDDDGGFVGTVGTAKAFTFTIWPPGENGAWLLAIFFAGHNGSCITRQEPAAGPDELKRAAEDWLAGFVSSLGAVFPGSGEALVRIEEEERPAAFFDEHDLAAIKAAADPGTTAATTAREKERPDA